MKKKISVIGGELFAKMFRRGASELSLNVDEINNLNVFPVPDGDTGDNMSMTLESGLSALENIDSDNLALVMQTLSHGMLLGARGNSGVILSQFFSGMSKGLDNHTKADAKTMGDALMSGVEQAYAAVVSPKEGTILTVAREAVEYAINRLDDKSTIRTLFADLVKEMNLSLQRTPELLPILKEAGVVDSGGAGLLHIMNGFNDILNGGKEKSVSRKKGEETPAEKHSLNIDSFGPDSELTYGYCTEILLRLQTNKVDPYTFDPNIIISYLQQIGDSIVAFRSDSIVKIHVHTKSPEKVLDFCHSFGEFLTVKIENMSLQHNESEEVANKPQTSDVKRKKYGSVAVCCGSGIRDVFTEFGVDCVIDGGQTQNSSVNDFLNAFASIQAEHIIVLPNNGNIVLAAKQAADMYKDSVIHVIETVNVGQGYAALPALGEEYENIDDLINIINESVKHVSEGEITVSVRDTDLNGHHISKNDYIGIHGKNIVVSDPDIKNALNKLADKLLTDGQSVLTVFFGQDATDSQKSEFSNYMAKVHPDIELYCIDGGQSVYPFILVTE